MPVNCSRTPRQVQAAQTTAPCAQPITLEELTAQAEPMHRYPHPIPVCREPAPACHPDCSHHMERVLEALSCQNQLLVDLLEAVRALTVALSTHEDKS